MQFMTMQEKQILAIANGIQKKNGGNQAIFRDNKATIILKSPKIQSNVWHFYPN